MVLDPKHVTLAEAPKVLAPDGSEVTILSATDRGSMAQFRLSAGCVSLAVRHHTVEEIWAIQQGRGEIWLSAGGDEKVIELSPGVSFAIDIGTAFQFRNDGDEDLLALAITMPPWPGENEVEFVPGAWEAILHT